MAVTVVRGDIFESDAQTVVNTVNCVGIMGKGLAQQFRVRFPEMFKDYVRRCEAGDVKLGRPYLYAPLFGKWILNFPTKDHWRSVTDLDDIVRGLDYLLRHYKEWGITSLAVPPLGCGLGQLDWNVVGPTLYRYLSRMDIPVELYAPAGAPDVQFSEQLGDGQGTSHGEFSAAKRIPSEWVALVEALSRLEAEPYAPPIGRVTFQKMAYAGQLAGLPLGLDFKRGPYGPFAPQLKPMLTKLVNNGILREGRLGRMLQVAPGPTFDDARKAAAGVVDDLDEPITRVVDLFMRLDTQRAEVVATVMFASRELASATDVPREPEVIDYVLDWKKGERGFDSESVEDAVHSLAGRGWVKVIPGSVHDTSDTAFC